MRFVDSHAHLADPAFDDDRDAVIARAATAGAAAVVCIGESIAAADRAALIASAHPGFVYHTAGVHPHDAAQFDAATRPRRASRALRGGRRRDRRVRARLPLRSLAARRAASRRSRPSFAWPRELGAPVVVHTREAEADTTAMVAEAAAAGVRGVLHCFTGSHALAETRARGRMVRLVQRHRHVQEVGRSRAAAARAGRPAARRVGRAVSRSGSASREAQRAGVRAAHDRATRGGSRDDRRGHCTAHDWSTRSAVRAGDA